MKICKVMLIVVMCICILSSCAKHNHATTPAGDPEGGIWQAQIMYNDVLYFYGDTGYSAPLPEGYELVGCVESMDKHKLPSKNFESVRLEVGQEVYASEEDETVIYVKFTDGYAKLEADEEIEAKWRESMEKISEKETAQE
ncbi:MAG: hypothetical protein J6J86_01530 [Lachnospiraceae bacterium]|nr:hypothetical protein [Lachnospiraceae bacterium]